MFNPSHRLRTIRDLLPLVLAFAALAEGPAIGRTESIAPEMLPAGDVAWQDLTLLELAGAIPVGLSAARPASRGEIAQWIAEAAASGRGDPACIVRLQRQFARELRRIGRPGPFRETPPSLRLAGEPSVDDTLALDGARTELRVGPTIALDARGGEGESRLTDSTRAGLYGVFLIGRSAALQGEIFVGRIDKGRTFGDPLINKTDILYFLEEAGITFATRDVRLRLTRGRHHWGAGWGSSLLLDQAAAPIGLAEWSLNLPKGIRFTSWSGSLNAAEERGIAAHRIEIPLGRDLRIAFSEGVRFSGSPAQPLYLMGILPYTLVQRLDWQDTRTDSLRTAQRNNVLAGAEVVWRPRPGSMTYLEVLADDLPARTGKMPARVGARLGIAIMPKIGGSRCDIGIEGTKVARYTYSVDYHDDCECDWIHQDRAIGEPGGPDQEALRLRAGRSIADDHRIEAEVIWANRGAGRLGEAWVGDGSPVSHPTRRGLSVSPPVERQRSLLLRWRWLGRDNLSAGAEVAGSFVRNPGNRRGPGWDERLTLALRVAWRH